MKRREFMVGVAAAATGRPSGFSDGEQTHRWKGRKNSKVKRWDIITIGNLSRNRFCGESDAKGVRAAVTACA